MSTRSLPWTAERVRALRERLGLTQHDLAVKLGVAGDKVISHWENGHNAPGRMASQRLDALEAEEVKS